MFSLLLAILVKAPAFAISVMYARYFSVPYRLVLVQIVLAMLVETAGSYIAIYLHQHNIWLFNIYWLADFWLLGIAGYLLIKNNPQKRLIPYIMAAITILWVLQILKQGIFIHPTWALCLMGVMLVYIYINVLATVTFHTGEVWRHPVFWLSISVLSFSSCTIPLYSAFNYLYEHKPGSLSSLFEIVIVLNFIRYPLVALSFYLYGKQRLQTIKTGNHVL